MSAIVVPGRVAAIAVLAMCSSTHAFADAAGAPLDRTVLPVAEPHHPASHELNARNAKAPPRFEVKAPKGAPTWSSC